jgi:hypothetical protein
VSLRWATEAGNTSPTIKYFYEATWRYNPEDSHLHIIRTSNPMGFIKFLQMKGTSDAASCKATSNRRPATCVTSPRRSFMQADALGSRAWYTLTPQRTKRRKQRQWWIAAAVLSLDGQLPQAGVSCETALRAGATWIPLQDSAVTLLIKFTRLECNQTAITITDSSGGTLKESRPAYRKHKWSFRSIKRIILLW